MIKNKRLERINGQLRWVYDTVYEPAKSMHREDTCPKRKSLTKMLHGAQGGLR